MLLNKNIKLLLNRVLGPLICILLLYTLYRQINKQPDVQERLGELAANLLSPAFFLAFLLMLVNWGIESRKWQLLVRPLEDITFTRAVKSVFAGCSITLLTPNRTGEFGGRILYLEDKHKIDGIALTILGSIAQICVTLGAGAIGVLFYYVYNLDKKIFDFLPANTGIFVLVLTTVATLFMLLLFFRAGFITKWLLRFKFLKRVTDHLMLLNAFSRKQLLRILWLSFLRYVVFILQYLLLLEVMQVHISLFDSVRSLSIFYLLLALAPTFGFTELPVRAAAAWEVFQPYSDNVIGIQAASLAIWIINLVIPAVTGSLLITGIKTIKEK